MSERRPGRPKKEGPWDPCKAEGCVKTVEGGAKGFCHSHYISARRGLLDVETGKQLRELQRVRSYGPGARCAIQDCGRRPKGQGLCEKHYQQQDRRVMEKTVSSYSPTTICLVVGCDQRPVNRGMCSKHEQQRRAGIIDEHGNQLRELLPTGRKRTRDRWVGSTRDGYILVVAPEGHPFARQDGTLLEHRFVMEQQLGHPLDPDKFLVHHKDGNRSNNAPENLEVLSSWAKTGEGHPPGSEISKELATQVLLQQQDLPDELRQWLEWYRQSAQ